MRFKDFIKGDTTLKLHKELNPKFWQDEKLDNKIKNKLISLAMYWADYAKIDEKIIKDIIFTGGNANYNYTDQSDVDVHLLIEKDKLKCDKLVDDYILDKKNLWSLNHNIKIMGNPVEIFAQDINQGTPADQGVYSLLKDKWITKPKKEFVNVKSKSFKSKIKHFIDLIDYFINNKIKDLDAIEKLKEKIRLFRAAGLKSAGEYSYENLIFKELRNLGYIDKLKDYADKVIDQKFSYDNSL
jgi:hypothetical protein